MERSLADLTPREKSRLQGQRKIRWVGLSLTAETAGGNNPFRGFLHLDEMQFNSNAIHKCDPHTHTHKSSRRGKGA